IKVNRQLTLVHEFRQFGQLSPIRAEVEEVCVNVTGGSHLLKIHNADEPSPLAHDLHTFCRCLSPNAIQDGIDTLRTSCVDSLCEVRLGIIDAFAGSQLLKVRVMLAF